MTYDFGLDFGLLDLTLDSWTRLWTWTWTFAWQFFFDVFVDCQIERRRPWIIKLFKIFDCQDPWNQWLAGQGQAGAAQLPWAGSCQSFQTGHSFHFCRFLSWIQGHASRQEWGLSPCVTIYKHLQQCSRGNQSTQNIWSKETFIGTCYVWAMCSLLHTQAESPWISFLRC